MVASSSAHPDRPALITWEVSRSADGTTSEELTSSELIIDELSRFDEGQRVLLLGTEDIARQEVQSLLATGRGANLDLFLSPADPRLFDRTYLRALASSGLAGLAIRLDGPDRETHDSYHGEGRFDAAIRLARWAAEFGLTLEVTTSISADSIDGIEHLAAKVLALGADRWVVSLALPREDETDYEEIRPVDAEEVLSWLAGLDARSRLTVTTAHAPMFGRIVAQAHEGDDEPSIHRPRVAGDSLLHVSAAGRIYPSRDLDLEVGNVLDDDIREVYREHPLLQAFRDGSRRKGKCRTCGYRSICGGSRARAYAHFDDPLEQDPLCPYVPAAIEQV